MKYLLNEEIQPKITESYTVLRQVQYIRDLRRLQIHRNECLTPIVVHIYTDGSNEVRVDSGVKNIYKKLNRRKPG